MINHRNRYQSQNENTQKIGLWQRIRNWFRSTRTEPVVRTESAPAAEWPQSYSSTSQTVRGLFPRVTADDLKPYLGTALQPHARDFIDAGRIYNLDPRFLAAISKLETGNGTSSAFRLKNNAMGISDSAGPIKLPSVRTSIFRQAASLSREGGYYDGANTIAEIGVIYAPPGAGNDPNATNGYWPTGVSKFYAEMLA